MLEWLQREAVWFLLVAVQRADTASRSAMRRSLTKREIIRKKQDINRIFRVGRSSSCSGMRLIVSSNEFGYDRIIVIPAKHYGRAVDRNLVRRRAKEIFRCYPGRIMEENPVQGRGHEIWPSSCILERSPISPCLSPDSHRFWTGYTGDSSFSLISRVFLFSFPDTD